MWGDPKTRNGRMMERQNGGKSPQILKCRTAEWWKIPHNPITWNSGKSPIILKCGKQK